MQEVQWNVNQNEFALNTIGTKIIKFELRRNPRQERMEDMVISWEEFNPTAVDYMKFPTFWGNVRSCRVLINNKEVVDMKTPEGVRMEYKTNIFARHRERVERNHHWAWITQGTSPYLQDPAVAAPLLENPIIPAGESRQFSATIHDLLPHVFEGLPMDKIYLIEIEVQLIGQDKNYLIGENIESTETICRNIQAWSKMKQYMLKIPKPFSNWTMMHKEHEVIRITSPSPIHNVLGGQIDLDLHTLVPRRSLIQRIYVYRQINEFSLNGHRDGSFPEVEALLLQRNGDDILATREFCKNRFEIARMAQKFYKRHHGGVHGVNPLATEGTNFGNAFPELFIDTTPVMKTINANPSLETKVHASEGIDNHSNLNLNIRLAPARDLSPNEDVIVVVEWCRYDRINNGGQVIRIQTP
jgi:hypothetical protein